MRLGPLSVCLLFAACAGAIDDGDGGEPIDAGLDAGATGKEDAGADAGEPADAGPSDDDAGTPDAGAPDAGPADAGRADAGPSDAGRVDSGVPDAGHPAACTGKRFCEDFETYPVGAAPTAPWSKAVNGGTIAIDGTRSWSGGRSVKFTTDGGAAFRQAEITITGAPVFPVPGNHVFGRMMVWIKAVPTTTNHWTNIESGGTVPDGGFYAATRYGGQFRHLMANYVTSGGPRSDCPQPSSVVPPEGRWACWEWEFDAPNRTTRFWLDGVAIPALTVVNATAQCVYNDLNKQWLFPTYDNLTIGWEHYQVSDAVEFWVDALALDTARIGCPP
ncbi:MAG: hypothetical protein IPJ65_30610 [Archangiaceae bacterium]|nr:hypothetical protein [Archangiaceae bacterium]